MHESDVVVIGAGAAGIAAARRVKEAHVPVVLLEARGRVGGRAWTYHAGDLALDLGCGWLHSADENELAALAPKLGFPVDAYPPPWSRPAYEANFPAAAQKDYWRTWERFYACVDAAAKAGSDRPMSDCFEPGGRWNAMLGVMATESLRFSPALPDKLAAAQLPLGLADKVFLRVDPAEDLPLDTRLAGSTTTRETGSYTLRPNGQPMIEGYFGGEFARTLEHDGQGAFAAFATEQIANALGSDMRKRLAPIAESAWARDPFALGAYSYGNPGAHAMRAKLAVPVAAKLFFAGEHCSAADFSTAHGAYRSGVKAAEDAIRALQVQPA